MDDSRSESGGDHVNNIALAVALFTEPRRAFDAIAARPRWLFPLLVLLLTSLALLVWYYARVDLEWLIDQQLSASPRAATMTEEQRQAAARFTSRGTMISISVIAVVLFIVLVRVLEAVWYLLAGKIGNVERSFRQWFSFACWTSLPQVIAVVPAVLVMMTTSTTQIDPGAINPLSLNELFFHRGMADPGYSFLTNVSVLHFVGLALAVFGLHHWSKRTWLFSSIFVLLPPVLIFGIWGYFSMVRG